MLAFYELNLLALHYIVTWQIIYSFSLPVWGSCSFKTLFGTVWNVSSSMKHEVSRSWWELMTTLQVDSFVRPSSILWSWISFCLLVHSEKSTLNPSLTHLKIAGGCHLNNALQSCIHACCSSLQATAFNYITHQVWPAYTGNAGHQLVDIKCSVPTSSSTVTKWDHYLSGMIPTTQSISKLWFYVCIWGNSIQAAHSQESQVCAATQGCICWQAKCIHLNLGVHLMKNWNLAMADTEEAAVLSCKFQDLFRACRAWPQMKSYC